MPKPLLKTQTKQVTGLETTKSIHSAKLSSLEIERILRQKRSPKYMESVSKLDSGGHVENKSIIQSLINAIKEELPEISIDQLPIGIVAKCYLEPPHEVHCLDVEGLIIRHYKTFEPLPPLLERARGLAIHGGYEFIEVYRDCLRAVKKDGSISIVKEE